MDSYKRLNKSSKKGFRGYPIATIAFYGKDNKTATKVVASIVESEHAGAEPVQKWYANSDVRYNELSVSKLLSLSRIMVQHPRL